MFNLKSKPQTRTDSALISSHAMFGWVTPRLQSVRPSYEGGSLLNQETSNAFQPFHYWNPCLTKQYSSNPTAILNFYRYLQKRSAIPYKGIRAVFITTINISSKYLTILEDEVHLILVLKYRVSATPTHHGG